jgi:HlyD family secretion protein
VNVLVDLTSAPEARARLGDRFALETGIVIDERPSALTVPTSALVRNGDAWSVFVVGEDGRARARAVTIGLRSGLEAEVVQGLQAGETVIVHPGDTVRDGAAVVRRE